MAGGGHKNKILILIFNKVHLGFSVPLFLILSTLLQRRTTMEKIKEIKQDKKTADIVILDEGIDKKNLGPQSICCWVAFSAVRSM
jgi:hypothetical protein